MAADLGLRPNRRDEDEPLTIKGIDHVVLLHDGADTLVEIWLQEDGRVFRATRYIDTIDLRAVKRFLEAFNIPVEIVDNS